MERLPLGQLDLCGLGGLVEKIIKPPGLGVAEYALSGATEPARMIAQLGNTTGGRNTRRGSPFLVMPTNASASNNLTLSQFNFRASLSLHPV